MDGFDIVLFIILPLFGVAWFVMVCYICWGFWKVHSNLGVGGTGNGTGIGFGRGLDNGNTGTDFGMRNGLGFGGMNDTMEYQDMTTTNRSDDDDDKGYGWNLSSEMSPGGFETGMDGCISGGMDMGTSGGIDMSCSGGGGGADTSCSGGTDSGTCGSTD